MAFSNIKGARGLLQNMDQAVRERFDAALEITNGTFGPQHLRHVMTPPSGTQPQVSSLESVAKGVSTPVAPGPQAAVENHDGPQAVPTALTAGSVAIVGFNTAQSDGSGQPATTNAIQFVLLSAIGSGTQIFFTDRSWNGSVFGAGGGDGTFTYTAGADLPAGTVVTISAAQLSAAGMDLDELGDTVYVYQGAADAPTTFLTAIEFGDNAVFNGSLANTGLVVGATALAIDADSGGYAGPTTYQQNALVNPGQTLLQAIMDANNWATDNRDNVNAHVQQTPGSFLLSPDMQIWGATSGGSYDGIVGVSVDSAFGGGLTGFNQVRIYNSDGDESVAYQNMHVAPRDLVIDTVHGKYFLADSDLAGTNRILQGNLSDLLGNPGSTSVPTLTVLYSDTSSGVNSQIRNLAINPDTGQVYFSHGSATSIQRINYDTAGQTPVTIVNLGAGNPNGNSNNFVDDFVINFATGHIYISSHRVTAAADGDILSRNFIYDATGLTVGTASTLSYSVLPFSPDDTAGGFFQIPGEAFPHELGSLEGMVLSPDGSTLYFATATLTEDTDGDGDVGDVVTRPGGIFSYALTGNPTGTYTTIFTQTLGGAGPQGLLDELEIDFATGRWYVSDTTGGTAQAGDEGIWSGLLSGGPSVLVSTIANANGGAIDGFIINRAPTVSLTAAANTYTETAGAGSTFGTAAVLLNGSTATDSDTTGLTDQMAGAVVRITTGFQTGADHQDRLTINGATSGSLDFGTQDIAFSYDSATGVMVLTGASTFANYQSALNLVRYSASGDNPTNYGTATTRTIAWSVSDGLVSSDEQTSTVTVAAVDDAAAVQADAVSTVEGGIYSGNVLVDNGSGADTDVDNLSLTVSAVNGVGASVGTQITLPSGALLTLNADGTFDYDPNGAFTFVPGPASGASNLTTTDSFTYTAGGGTATVTITINGQDTNGDILIGTSGDDVLDGGAGNDTVDYSGASSRVLAQLNDTIRATDGDGGRDTLINIENLTGSAFNDLLIGSDGDNILTGGLGADVLLGLGGNDILIGGTGAANQLQGGLGDDIYVVDANDTLVEFAGEGTDSVQTSRTTYVLKDNFENLLYTGSAAFRGTGNSANNTIEGGSGDDVLIGRGGIDLLDGNSGNDTADYSAAAGGVTANLGDGAASNDGDGASDILSEIENLTGSGFTDSLTGDAMANLLSGGAGDDVLAGRGGNDVLRGGAGFDTADYSGAAAGVTVKLNLSTATDDGDGGTDSFNSIENITGSVFNDLIFGDAGNNVLSGGLGADILLGLDGNDILIGGAGAANTLQGGLGDDTYVVSANDTITEFAGQGIDTVQTDRAYFTLAANLENLTYTGSGAFTGTGNAEANVITGGAGSDYLIGGQGNDTLIGGGGIDYVVLSGVLADYAVTDLGGGSYRIVDSVGGRDGTDVTIDVERVRFSTGPTVTLASLAMAPPAPLEPVDKTAGGPQVLPGLVDDDFLIGKHAGTPEVLPGIDDLFGGLDGLSVDRAQGTAWLMLSETADGAIGHMPDAFHGSWDHSGWNHDGFLF